MTLIIYFVSILLLLLASALFIGGFFAATRGEYKDLPNGEREKSGKVLKGWYFYWMKELGNKHIPFKGEKLDNLFFEISSSYPALQILYVQDGELRAAKGTNREIFIDLRKASRTNMFKYKIYDLPDIDHIWIHVYVEKKMYRFPEWLRDMMAGCITCHSSLYGNIIFWSFFLLSRKYLFNTLFSWSEYPFAVLFGTWLWYWAALAYSITYFWKNLMK